MSIPSTSNRPKIPAFPAPEPLPVACTPNAKSSHQTLRRGHGKRTQSGPNNEGHTKKPSIGHASISSYHSSDTSNSYTGHRKLWDKGDTFLPCAKPPPPLPVLGNHKRTRSQHHIESPLGRPSMSHGTFRPPHSISSTSTSTDPSLYELPVLDISREYVDIAPKSQNSLTRSNTRITASSGTSDESLSKQWKPPPSWAGPHAWVDTNEAKTPKPMRSLSRLRSRKRAQSNQRGGCDATPTRPRTPESVAIPVVYIAGSEETCGRDRGRCPSSEVKVQYYEGRHEKPVEDVVHMLRELKLR